MKKYSIVVFLEGAQKDKVKALQEELFKITGSRECLDAWKPHFTVGDGVITTPNNLSMLEEKVEEFVTTSQPFTVTLRGFGGKTDRKGGAGEITTPYVLWIEVLPSEELNALVNRCQRQVTSAFDTWYQMPRPFVPHVTVAFRDLTANGYEAGKEYLKSISFEESVEVSHVALVEKLPASDEEYMRFAFQTKK